MPRFGEWPREALEALLVSHGFTIPPGTSEAELRLFAAEHFGEEAEGGAPASAPPIVLAALASPSSASHALRTRPAHAAAANPSHHHHRSSGPEAEKLRREQAEAAVMLFPLTGDGGGANGSHGGDPEEGSNINNNTQSGVASSDAHAHDAASAWNWAPRDEQARAWDARDDEARYDLEVGETSVESFAKPDVGKAREYAGLHHPRRMNGQPYPVCSSRMGRHCPTSGPIGVGFDCLQEGAVSEMARYGPGLSLHFKNLKFLFWIFFFASCISLPQMIINTQNTTNGGGLFVTTVGNLFAYTNSSFTFLCPSSTFAGQNGTTTFVLCDYTIAQLAAMYTYTDFALVIVVALALLWLHLFVARESTQIAKLFLSLDRYSVLVENLPPGCGEIPLGQYMERVTGEEVHEVNIAYNDGALISLFIERGEIVSELWRVTGRAVLLFEHAVSPTVLYDEEEMLSMKAERLERIVDYYDLLLTTYHSINEQTRAYKSNGSRAILGIVTFETVHGMNKALDLLGSAPASAPPVVAPVAANDGGANDDARSVARNTLYTNAARTRYCCQSWYYWCCSRRRGTWGGRRKNTRMMMWNAKKSRLWRSAGAMLQRPNLAGGGHGGGHGGVTALNDDQGEDNNDDDDDSAHDGVIPDFQGKFVSCRPSPPPSTILWENIEFGLRMRILRQAVAFVLVSLALLVSFAAGFGSIIYRRELLIAQESGVCNATAGAAGQFEGGAECCGSYSFARASYSIFTPGEACHVYWVDRAPLFAFTLIAAFVVSLVNIVVAYLVQSLSSFEHHHSLVNKDTSVALRLFVAYTINIGFVYITVNLVVRAASPAAPTGLYELNDEWYANVGEQMLILFLLNMVMIHFKLAYDVVTYAYLFYFGDKALLQRELNERFVGPEFPYAMRTAQMFMQAFLCLLFGSGMPLLYVISCVSFACTYYIDKWSLLRFYRTPPEYDSSLSEWLVVLLWMGLLGHIVFAIWTYSAPGLFWTWASATAGSSSDVSAAFLERMTQPNILPLCVLFLFIFALWLSTYTLCWSWAQLRSASTTGEDEAAAKTAPNAPPAGTNELPPLLYAKDSGYLRGLRSYNILQNPKYRRAFGVPKSFCDEHSHVNSVLALPGGNVLPEIPEEIRAFINEY